MSAALGCSGGGESSRDDGVLRLWKATHGETARDWERLLAPFQALHPELKVEVMSHPWDGWDERYVAAFSGGNLAPVRRGPTTACRWPGHC